MNENNRLTMCSLSRFFKFFYVVSETKFFLNENKLPSMLYSQSWFGRWWMRLYFVDKKKNLFTIFFFGIQEEMKSYWSDKKSESNKKIKKKRKNEKKGKKINESDLNIKEIYFPSFNSAVYVENFFLQFRHGTCVEYVTLKVKDFLLPG
jgi:hypothetical protein